MPASFRPTCPACGIAVTPGYQRCPKCHRPLPTSVRFSRLLTDSGGGATTLEPEVELHARWPWYLAGLVVLASAVTVIVVGATGGSHAAPLPDDPVVEDEVEEPQAGSVDEDPSPVPPPRLDPGPAADRLERLLGTVRLYATVEAAGDTIDIISASCADPGLAGPLGEVAPDLREAGVLTVRCRAQGGAEQWTRPLP